MVTWGTLIGALALFVLGLWLSAFFSGNETGFYRVSFLRLSIDANAGDRIAKNLLWFARNPNYFMATTLVGNNVANYLTTIAIGLAVSTLLPTVTHWAEVVATLAVAPIVFVCAELIPKSLYYRAPLHFLRRDAGWFILFYRLFLVISFPLIGITKLIQRWGGSSQPKLELVLGRSRLVQVLSYGHQAGLLTRSQGQIVHGLLHTAVQAVERAMIPLPQVSGVPDNLSAAEVLDFAAKHGLSHVPIRRADSDDDWYGYVRVVDLAVGNQSLPAAIHSLPRVEGALSKLEALRMLRNTGNEMCAVTSAERVVGIVVERTLVEELFTAPPAVGLSVSGGR